MLFLRVWHNYHIIALVFRTILLTMDCVYLQLPSGNPPFPVLKALESEQWHILYSITSVVHQQNVS
jgi:hypothetical protein